MKHSIFNALLSVKTKLTDSIQRQLNLANALSDAYYPDVSANYDSLTDVELDMDENVVPLDNNSFIKFGKSALSNVLNYVILSPEIIDGSYSSSVDISDESFNIEDDLLDREALVPGSDLSVSVKTAIVNLLQGESVNEAIEKVNELFLNSTNVATSDALSMIDSVSGLTSSDLNQLKSYVTTLSDGGVISNYSWTSFLSTLTNEGKEQCDSGSLSVSEEGFFRLQSFMNTVMTVVSVVFNVVIGVLGAIFYGLYHILNLVLQAFNNLFSATFNTDYDYKANATYPGIRGTVYAGSPTFLQDVLDVGTNELLRIQLGSEDVYVYKVADESTDSGYKVYLQEQLVLSFHPYRLFNYLKQEMSLTSTLYDDVASINRYNWGWSKPFTPWTYVPTGEDDQLDPYMKLDEYISNGIDSNSLVRCVKINVLSAFLTRTVLSSIGTISNGALVADSVTHASTGAGLRVALAYFNKMLLSDGSESSINSILDSMTNTDVRYLVEELIRMSSSASSCSVQENQDIGDVYYYPFPIHGVYKFLVISGDSYEQVSLHTDADKSDAFPDVIPKENMVSIPSLDISQILAAIAIVSGVIVGSVILGKKIISALKAKKQTRQTKRIQQLNAARDAWLADPTNKQLKKAYTKQVSKYNFKASLFGWGSYDAANGWVNAKEVSSSSSDVFNEVVNNTTENDVDKIIQLISL